MADPGSIFVSAPVVRSADHDRRRHFVRLGRRKAKNITEGLDVYAVNASARSRLGRWIPATCLGRSATIAAIVATLGFLPFPAVADHGTLCSAVEHVAAQTLRLAGVSDVDFRPTVAVLPFDNMSREQDETYLVDGLTEDIITGSCTLSRTSSDRPKPTYALRDEAADVRRTGELLGAGYHCRRKRTSGRRSPAWLSLSSSIREQAPIFGRRATTGALMTFSRYKPI